MYAVKVINYYDDERWQHSNSHSLTKIFLLERRLHAYRSRMLKCEWMKKVFCLKCFSRKLNLLFPWNLLHINFQSVLSSLSIFSPSFQIYSNGIIFMMCGFKNPLVSRTVALFQLFKFRYIVDGFSMEFSSYSLCQRKSSWERENFITWWINSFSGNIIRLRIIIMQENGKVFK